MREVAVGGEKSTVEGNDAVCGGATGGGVARVLFNTTTSCIYWYMIGCMRCVGRGEQTQVTDGSL